MRKIKFRIFNGSEIKYPTNIQKYSNVELHTGYAKDYTKEGVLVRPVFDKCVFMQFTGLQDKKGIEIYEGDIVDYRCKSQPDKKDLRIVKFHENGFFSATGGYDINLYAIKDAVIVVGNIYENPELLSTPTAVL